MRTITISKDHRKQKQAKIQRETIITPILAEKYKRERREKDEQIPEPQNLN